MKFILNGFPEDFQGATLTIQTLLEKTQEDDPAVIVELNGRFVHRRDFSSRSINEGDRVEFIHPSFGG
ncbi:MAG: sulfur carrier protein ThiS [Deltaproteobacteria bacterium]|nr:sulfur carrier protein ThiS [Deltaproteobacteria bacterium]